MLIEIEGTDGSGKKTQSVLLKENLEKQGKKVKLISFPTYDSPACGAVKMYLGGELSSTADGVNCYQASTLYAVDRFCTMKKEEEFLNSGGIIVLDRYVGSNLIHQLCKIDNKKEKKRFVKFLHSFEYGILKLPIPDMVIFLNMPAKKSIVLSNNRAETKGNMKKDIHEQDSEHLTKAYKAGIEVAEKLKWEIVDCLDENEDIKSKETISEEILQIVNQVI